MPIAHQGLLMQAIKHHLSLHPKAADSAEGIGMWWLGGQGIHVSPSRLALALRALVRQRHLRALRLPGGTLLYAAAPAGVRRRHRNGAR